MGWYDSGASSLAGMAQIAQNYKAEPNAGASIAGGIDTAVQKIKGRAEEIRLNDLRVASEGRVKDLLAQPPKAGENPTQWLSQVAEAGSYLDPQKKAALDQTIKGYTMQYENDTKALLQEKGFAHSEKLAKESNALQKEQIDVTRENNKAIQANAAAQLGLQKEKFANDAAIQDLQQRTAGFEKIGNKYTFTGETPEFKQAIQMQKVADWEKVLGSPMSAADAGTIAKNTSNFLKFDSSIGQDALDLNNRLAAIGTKDNIMKLLATEEGSRLLTELRKYKGTADLEGANPYLSKASLLLDLK